MKKVITQLDQINMLNKYANRNGRTIKGYRTVLMDGTKLGNAVVYADYPDGSWFTIFCLMEEARYLFTLINKDGYKSPFNTL